MLRSRAAFQDAPAAVPPDGAVPMAVAAHPRPLSSVPFPHCIRGRRGATPRDATVSSPPPSPPAPSPSRTAAPPRSNLRPARCSGALTRAGTEPFAASSSTPPSPKLEPATASCSGALTRARSRRRPSRRLSRRPIDRSRRPLEPPPSSRRPRSRRLQRCAQDAQIAGGAAEMSPSSPCDGASGAAISRWAAGSAVLKTCSVRACTLLSLPPLRRLSEEAPPTNAQYALVLGRQ